MGAVGTMVLVISLMSTGIADCAEVDDSFEERRLEYLEHCAADSGGNTYTQIAKMELGLGPIYEGGIDADVEFVNSREDCSDFKMQGLLRLLYQYGENPLLSEEVKSLVRACVLDFKYWIDEPGIDSMCYWSENHQILFHAAEYLAGQLFPTEVFSNNGLTGLDHREKAWGKIRTWLDRRAAFGFSEWHSNVYYEEDLAPLLNLADFALDEEIATRAAMITDIMLFEIALSCHDGVFGSSHGRSYGKNKMGGRREGTASVAKLVTGSGIYHSTGSMAAVSLAVAPRYTLPGVIVSVGEDAPPELVDKERIGIEIDDGPGHGIGYTGVNDVIFWWGMGGYVSSKVIEGTIEVVEELCLWENEFLAAVKVAALLEPLGILPELTALLTPMTEGSVLSTVDTYTFRTPHYMLCCAQDFRPGYWGAQQHIWQATLDLDAVVFTTHPGGLEDDDMYGPWTGGWLPRAAQHENVLVAIYRLLPISLILDGFIPSYTHAYFPREHFEEMIEQGGWTFGRKGDGYVGLYSDRPTHWTEEGPYAGVELVADGASNVWICEMGSAAENGSFDAFVEAVSAAPLTVLGSRIVYDSPSVGRVNFGWQGPLKVDGRTIEIHGYERFDNSYCLTPVGSGRIYMEKEARSLLLDFAAGERIVVD